MEVNSVGAASGLTQTSQQSASSQNTLDYNSFLRLLVAELQNQDPTNPTDPTQYMSQIASFSAVEQQINSNTKLDALLTSMTITQASGLVGRNVSTDDGSISGSIASIRITSNGAEARLENGKSVTLGPGVTVS
ncbi:MAG: flagellar hook assembly protein FlgD [Hyphomicrobiaceae bacterium]